jgi:uncharacterized phage infection (PIP) family protein YhgE
VNERRSRVVLLRRTSRPKLNPDLPPYEKGHGLYRNSDVITGKPLGERNQGLGEHNQGLGEHNQGLGEHNQGLGERNQGLGERNQGLGERNQGLGEHNQGLGEHNQGLGEHNQGLGEHNQDAFFPFAKRLNGTTNPKVSGGIPARTLTMQQKTAANSTTSAANSPASGFRPPVQFTNCFIFQRNQQ